MKDTPQLKHSIEIALKNELSLSTGATSIYLTEDETLYIVHSEPGLIGQFYQEFKTFDEAYGSFVAKCNTNVWDEFPELFAENGRRLKKDSEK